MFVSCLPNGVMSNAIHINNSGIMKLSADNNTTKRVIKRFLREQNRYRIDQILYTFFNLSINLWVWLLEELQILWFNYFAAVMVLMF